MNVLTQVLRARANIALHPRRRGPDDIRASGFGPSDIVPALEGAWRQFIDLLRGLEHQDGSRPIPHLDWTVAETAAHVLTVVRRGVDTRRVTAIEEGSGALNQQCLDELEERDVQRLADLLEGELSELRPMLRTLPMLWSLRVGRWVTFKLHAGVEADLPTAFSYPLGDFLVHGYDIATAVGRPWTIEPAHASIALRAFLPTARHLLASPILDGPSQRVAIAFPDGKAVEVAVGVGDYSVGPIKSRDAEGETNPAELQLALWGRGRAADPLAARLVSWFVPV